MARIETYGSDNIISSTDKVIGTDSDSNKATKNYEMGAIRDYVISGLPPSGGTFAITTITQDTPLVGIETPEDLVNQLDPNVVVADYEMVFVVLTFNDSTDNNTEKTRTFVFKQVGTTVGLGQTPTVSNDYLLINETEVPRLLKVFKDKIFVSNSSTSGGVFTVGNGILNRGFTNSITYTTANNIITLGSVGSEFTTDKTHIVASNSLITSISDSSVIIDVNNITTATLIPIFISIEVYA